MVAPKWTVAERFRPPPQEFLEGRWKLHRFTLHDAQEMVRLGIIPEDASTELLDGLIVLTDRAAQGQDSMTIGKDHADTVERLSNLRIRINDGTRHVKSQQPLICTETHVPQPDFMVIRGALRDYTDHPKAADALCVVEVADASYERDAISKLAGYARAGVLQYIIVNLRNRTAEVYTNPDISAGAYPSPQLISQSDLLAIRIGVGEYFSVPMKQILP